MQYRIRQERLSTEEIRLLDERCFSGQEGLASALDGTLWVARSACGVLVGYATASIRRGVLDLTRAAVLEGHRGNGLQRRLIRARLTWGRRHGATSAWTYTDVENFFSMRSLVLTGFMPTRVDGRFLEFQRFL